MSYSAFFTAGLTLASQPRDYESFSPLQINVHPGTPRRTRKRRSSLTIATSPISSIKSPARNANDAARSALRSASPRDGTFFEALQSAARPKMARRKTVSSPKDPPSFPAPTTPLPTVPTLHVDLPRGPYTPSAPITSTEDVYLSSPIAADPPRPAYHPGSLRANPARKSSFILPMGRGALLPSAHAGNIPDNNLKGDLDMDILMEVKISPAAVWSDDEEIMKENGGDV
ncbi:hypothetical protein JB92DRAFT_1611906 [Gautieria morchelliformis]|nr:hypothetical protein JB92DRAFT_1611906 [Gautieria morchelliformis]